MKLYATLLLIACSIAACAQTRATYTGPSRPSNDALVVSMKTMKKALMGCRATLTDSHGHAGRAFIRSVTDQGAYSVAMSNLDDSEKMVDILLTQPYVFQAASLVLVDIATKNLWIVSSQISDDLMAKMGDPKFDKSMFTPEDFTFALTRLRECHSALMAANSLDDQTLSTVLSEEDEMGKLRPRAEVTTAPSSRQVAPPASSSPPTPTTAH